MLSTHKKSCSFLFLHAFLLLYCFLGNGGKLLEGKGFLDVQLFSFVSTLVQKSERALNRVSTNPETPESTFCFLQGVRMFLLGRCMQSSNILTVICSKGCYNHCSAGFILVVGSIIRDYSCCMQIQASAFPNPKGVLVLSFISYPF